MVLIKPERKLVFSCPMPLEATEAKWLDFWK